MSRKQKDDHRTAASSEDALDFIGTGDHLSYKEGSLILGQFKSKRELQTLNKKRMRFEKFQINKR